MLLVQYSRIALLLIYNWAYDSKDEAHSFFFYCDYYYQSRGTAKTLQVREGAMGREASSINDKVVMPSISVKIVTRSWYTQIGPARGSFSTRPSTFRKSKVVGGDGIVEHAWRTQGMHVWAVHVYTNLIPEVASLIAGHLPYGVQRTKQFYADKSGTRCGPFLQLKINPVVEHGLVLLWFVSYPSNLSLTFRLVSPWYRVSSSSRLSVLCSYISFSFV